jgi:hypothetical protein
MKNKKKSAGIELQVKEVHSCVYISAVVCDNAGTAKTVIAIFKGP